MVGAGAGLRRVATSRTAGMEYLATQWKALGADVDVQVMPDAQVSEVLFSTGAWDITATPFMVDGGLSGAYVTPMSPPVN